MEIKGHDFIKRKILFFAQLKTKIDLMDLISFL